jgi:transposase-like protein
MFQELVQQTRLGFAQLLEALNPDKYPKVRMYLQNLYQHTMIFLDYWVQNKQWIPLNTNAIESAVSRITNRIK